VGCTVFDLMKVRDTERMDAEYARVSGTVSPGDVKAQWMVVYLAKVPCNEDWTALRERVASGILSANPSEWAQPDKERFDRLGSQAVMAEHIVLQRPGVWWADLAPGCYGVGAFADLDRDYRYDNEPVASAAGNVDRLLELKPGDRIENIDLVIDANARLLGGFDLVTKDVDAEKLRSHGEQLLFSVSDVSVEGKVIPLSDIRFGSANARLGYFQIYRFLWDVGPGIYFLEEYDPKRIPVLYVHGALGYPQEFRSLIASLDRTRFQPWVFFYPSGAELGAIAEYLTRIVTNLRLRLDVGELAVVAHSMGGLVAREFVLRNHERAVGDPVRAFITLSTPWDGVPSAAEGADRSPFVVPSWRDVKPDSDFLKGLFFEDEAMEVRRHLPEKLATRLLFGVKDQTIPLTSAIRWEALEDADDRWPLPYGHADILRSPEASRLVNELLDDAL
jgi:pimeloyl-ACP methyl ester carboxylesterase